MTNQDLDTARTVEFVPVLPYLVVDPDGNHGLTGIRCGACGMVIAGDRLACPACGNRRPLERIRLATHGTVQAHTVVHRSFPSVKTPFVAVVVDLDGGGSVRGTLTDVDPLGQLPDRVEMVFRDSGQRDKEGRPFLCYYFVPEGVQPS